MPKQQRFCIFCGGSPRTKEHLFADWLSEYIPRELERHRIQKTLEFPHKTQETIERREGDTHSRTVKCVCKPCNSGWMSDLQAAAKPYLVPMLLGEKIRLNAKQQAVLAAWVTMTVVIGDAMDESMAAVSPEERATFMARIKAPPYWRIWIGRYVQERGLPLYHHRTMALTNEKVEGEALFAFHPSNSQTTTICLGKHLIIHVMSSPIVRGVVRRWKLPPHIAPKLRQICPNLAPLVVWPQNDIISHRDVIAVADQFYNRVAFLQRREAQRFTRSLFS